MAEVLSDFGTEIVSWAQKVRPESRIHEMSLSEKVGYVWKYLAAPMLEASPALIRHFDEQKRLQAWLRHGDLIESCASLAFAGDLMWIRSHWGSFLPATTLARLQKFDGIVANLETMISPRFPVREFLPDILRFNSSERLVTSFRSRTGRSLFAALGLANNHSLDLGDAAAMDTLDFLASQGISTSGLGLHQHAPAWTSFERGGIKFGFYAGCYGLNDPYAQSRSSLVLQVLPGLAPEDHGVLPDLSLALRALQEMDKAGVDVKITLLHWGSEFEFYPTARMMRVARALVTGGADFVVGSHPHVPQPMELLFVNGFEQKIPVEALSYFPSLKPGGHSLLRAPGTAARMACVLYSMGNFTTNMFTTFCRAALLAGVHFRRDPSGKVTWTIPELSFYFNLPPVKGSGRALLHSDEIGEAGREWGSRNRFEEKKEFLRAHVGAS